MTSSAALFIYELFEFLLSPYQQKVLPNILQRTQPGIIFSPSGILPAFALMRVQIKQILRMSELISIRS